MAVDHPVWTGAEWVALPVPDVAGEALVLPLVAALVYDGLDRRRILLQRRDRLGEVVRGRLELPGGRWSAGERPDVAVAREVLEETGIRLTAVAAAIELTRHETHVATATARPLAVVTGVEGAFPALHVLFECYGEGDPRPVPGEVADPRWWPVSDVRRHLAEHPAEFVWHARALLAAAGFG